MDLLEQLVDEERSVLLVAVHPSSVLLGSARLLRYEGVFGWVLCDLYVCPNWRRTGVGTALVRRAMEYARCSGERLSLHVRKDLLAARALYRELGWKRLGPDAEDPDVVWMEAPR